MKCHDSRELLIEYSLGQLDPARTSEVRAHLAKGCAVCAEQLAEIQDSWASLAASLEPVPPSPAVEKKLLAMIRGEIAPPVELTNRQEHRERSRLLAYVLAASLVGIAAGVVVWNFTPLGTQFTGREVAVAPADAWGAPNGNADQPGFQTVALEPIAEQKGVQVAIVMNQATRQWHVIGSGLPEVATGEHYQLWLETKSKQFLPVEQLTVDHNGHGGVIIDLPEEHAEQLAGVWLTIEKAEEPGRPSEQVLFHAAIK
jgi:hypothetical protein